uniref:Metal-binding protein n=1 Tax=Archaeoglobus fulgidus TaxID=2234 RepID=A0A7C3RCI9_ARCFL
MLQRLNCECGAELASDAAYCLNCGKRHAIGCGVYVSGKRVYAKIFGKMGHEEFSLKRYDEEVSIRNLYEILGERIYFSRVEEVVISGECRELIEEGFENLRNSLYPFEISFSDVFETPEEFFEKLERVLRVRKELKTVDKAPEDKIQGSHSTIIGGREGYSLILSLARCPYVKKVVPGVIEGNATSIGGGVKLKLTRSDEKGNVRALLIDGSSVQQIHVITTASNREEGEEVLKLLRGYVRDIQD